mgnify:CR=1 FL=1
MPRRKESVDKPSKNTLSRPCCTPEAQEDMMISLAMERAEEQLRDGTASSQVITHFLKLGSSREKAEQEIIELNKELVKAKTESLRQNRELEEMFKNAIEAIKSYGGNKNE